MVKRLIECIKPYWTRLLAAILCMAVISLCTVGSVALIKMVFDRILVEKDASTAGYYLRWIPLALIGIYLVQGIFWYARDYLVGSTGNKVITDLRNRIYERLQGLSMTFYSDQRTGQLISRMLSDVTLMNVADILNTLVSNIFMLAGLIIYLFYLNWFLALIAFIAFPLALYPLYRFGQVQRQYASKSQAKIGEMTSILHESIYGIRIIKAFSMEKQAMEKFRNTNRNIYDIAIRAIRNTVTSSRLMELIGAFGVAFIIWFGGHQVLSGRMSAGAFTAFGAALLSLYRPLKDLNGINQRIQQALAASERVFEILDAPVTVMEIENAADLPALKQGIVYQDVDFSYVPGKPVLQKINFKVMAGQMVALVGPSGAGKSTMVDLLPRFYDPERGRILIDGADIRDKTLKSLRAQIGIVTQETILFSDTISNNISVGSPDATKEEIIYAAKTANAHQFIIGTHDGYMTVIGERGMKLSGGEKQRIAIARAILKNPPILILDEATSALDTESEILVQQALANLMADRTTLVIAHRLSTVKRADLIIVLDQGKVVETGRHEELLAKNGLYRRLYDLQFRV